MKFTVLQRSQKSQARLGLLATPHGVVETPALVAVATQAAVKTITSGELKMAKSKIAISNTFYLHEQPGEEVISKLGGLNKFMAWDGVTMTDSAGFQVFSLGFGLDFGIGKKIKYFPGRQKLKVDVKDQPKGLKITQDGVYFSSPFDGQKLFIGPKESISIQEKLGADIIFAFDECTPPLITRDYARLSLLRTHRWAKICRETHRTKQALFGIVQGSNFRELREESARYINSLGFEGFGIGGDLGESKTDTRDILRWTLPILDEGKPRHLLGIGYPEDMELIIKEGIDLFDCTVPTHYGRRGIAFTREGRLNFRKSEYESEKSPLDKDCLCTVCTGDFPRYYINHLIRAREILGLRLLTLHNLYYFNTLVEKIREKIKEGKV
ncbi:tRNA guanosine(34) transglycosylase Tgt [Patescibacteria group bacterium]|nr:tRNA guanosine(34) transglycosylase Tgt [Patescibacteria group bacterium]MCL5798233.1 tRNA guanosine(34) transglycosylase Tgt [Patescibacteria group bacterium]